MFLLLALFVAVAIVAVPVGRRIGPRVFVVAAVPFAVTLAWAVARTAATVAGESYTERLAWVPALGLDLDLRLDGITLVMTWLVAAIGVLVMTYAKGYFAPGRRDTGRFAAAMVLFGGSMCGLVWSDNILGLFVFWELTSVCSYSLIGFDDRAESARNSALQALLVTGAGGLALLFGLVLAGEAAGTYSLSGLAANPPGGAMASAAAVLVLIGAFTKSAQVPFHGWLPAAMAAPTPVSAYLHSATMVKAGVFIVAVMTPVFGGTGTWKPLAVVVGSATTLWGSYQAVRQRDLKLILAYSTIAALGSMIALFALGTPKATFAGVAVVVAHAMYKASAFMIVGIVDHAAHTRDISRLRGVGRRLPVVAAIGALCGASMAAIPATAGFVAKESALEALTGSGRAAVAVMIVLAAGSALTVAAVWRFWRGAFGGAPLPPGGGREVEPIDVDSIEAPRLSTVVPAGLLALAGIVAGVGPAVIDSLVAAGAGALDPGARRYALHAFAGFNTAFAVSVAALGAGGVLVAVAEPFGRAQARIARSWTATGAFREAVASLLKIANAITGVVQSGSLPTYLGVIALTAVLVPGVALVRAAGVPSGAVLAESPLQAAAVVAIVAGAVAAMVLRRRFAAVLCLGTVGYAVGLLFVAYGAPDLALTQFLVETVAVVAFVLVLRRLPDQFSVVAWKRRELLRAATSVAVGLAVFGFLVASGGGDPARPTDQLMAVAEPQAGGGNVVNVILTDIRALDTLGETSVVAVAAFGVIALTRLPRAHQRIRRGSPPPERSVAANRSTVLDAAVRVTFPLVVVLSLFLLLAGHDSPGGGFIAGLVAAAGLVLREVAQPAVPLPWERSELLIGGGLVVSIAVAVLTWMTGGAVLDMGAVYWELPIVGAVKLGGALVFDVGVYAVVIGMMVAVLQGLGGGSGPDPGSPSGRPVAPPAGAGR